MNRDAENMADYDAANRLLSERQNIGAGAKTFTYTYTNDNLPDTVTYPSGAQVQQTYTNRRQLYAVNLAAPGEQQLTPQAWHEYDAAGRLTMRHRANNTETLWEYDANSCVAHIAHQAAQGGQIFQSWTYAYTDAGNPLAQKDTTPNLAAWGEAYRYDQMNRLIDAKRGPVDANNNVPILDILLRQQWDLTKVGDWEQWTKSQQGQQDVIETREHNDLHSLTSRSIAQEPAKNLVYDANGSQVDDGEHFLFEYDANDQLKTVRNRATAAVVAEYRYDVFGRRIEKDVKAGNPKGAPVGITRYYYTGQRIAEERDGNDVVQAFYTYGHYIDEPLTMDRWNGETFTRHFYHQNRMFSTYVLTDSQGAVVERYAYTAYGECTTYQEDYTQARNVSNLGNHRSFTGKEVDPETGLANFNIRAYNTATGRPNQLDPLGLVDGHNLYEFFVSQPTRYLDFTGGWVIDGNAARIEAGDTLESLALKVTGNKNDWRKLPRNVRAMEHRLPIGRTINIGALTALVPPKAPANPELNTQSRVTEYTEPETELRLPPDKPRIAGGRTVRDCPKDKRKPRTGYEPVINGCGPAESNAALQTAILMIQANVNIDFTPACNRHDRCWGTCNSNRDQCDMDFKRDMIAECMGKYGKTSPWVSVFTLFVPEQTLMKCTIAAEVFYRAVNSKGGDDAYWSAQEDACYCCE